MGGQGERSANQSVKSDVVADRFLGPSHGIQNHRNSASVLIGNHTFAGYGFVRCQGMAFDGRGIVFRPHQVASQNLRFNLQVEDDRHAVRHIKLGHFFQRFDDVVGVSQHFFCGISLQFACMDAGKRHPGVLGQFFVSQCFKNKFLAHLFPPFVEYCFFDSLILP